MKRILTFAIALAALVSCGTEPASLETVTMPISLGSTVVRIQKPEMKKGSKCPVAILCHGLTGNKDERHLSILADSLLSYGVGSVRFDFNGHGESTSPFSRHTLYNELDDLQIIYDYVCTLDWVDTGRIGFAGHSQGGAIAGMKAGMLGKRSVKCLALMAPAALIHTGMSSGESFWGVDVRDIEALPDTIPFWGDRFIGKEYVKSAVDLDIHAITAQYDGPTCLLQGDKDDEEIFRQALRYKDYMPEITVFILPGYDHCYTQNVSEALVPAIHFLVDNLK